MARGDFQRVEGFPKKRVTKDGMAGTDKVWGTLAAALRIENDYPVGTECDFIDGLVLDSIDIDTDKSGTRGLCTLNYAKADTGDVQVDSNKAEYTADSMGSHEPLRSLGVTQYKMRWDHALIKKNGAIDYTGYDTPHNDIPSSTYKDNKWIGWDAEIPDGWVLQEIDGVKARALKPGINTYVAPQPIIHETKYYSSPKKAGAALTNVGKTATPGQMFGLTATSAINAGWATFLITGASVSQTGRKWGVRLDYQYSATGWDPDIYSAVS